MPIVVPEVSSPVRGRNWKWLVCGLLLSATMVNYMDRLTLNQMAVPIKKDFGMNDRHYGQLESAFGAAFALGAIVAGWVVDRWNVRLVYAAAVLLWSLAGFLTGFVQGFAMLLLCRFLLGLAESGHWPSALRTTQHILPPSERTMGNSILQSGAAIGSVLTPLVVFALYRKNVAGSWRYPFMLIGSLGLLWTAAWMLSVRRRDLTMPQGKNAQPIAAIVAWVIGLYAVDLAAHVYFKNRPLIPLAVKFGVMVLSIGGVIYWLMRATRDKTEETASASQERRVFLRRFAVLVVLVTMLNATWHFFRVWMPLFLQKQHGYSPEAFNWFTMAYYLSTDAGCLLAGFVTLRLARRGLPVHTSRVVVFAVCAVLTTLSVVAAKLPAGWPLLGVLLVIGFACLGLFPNYYSFAQELSVRHQGKVSGALGFTCWMSMSFLHEVVGDMVERRGNYSLGVGCAGLLPLIGLAALVAFWGQSATQRIEVGESDAMPAEPQDGGRPAVDSLRS